MDKQFSWWALLICAKQSSIKEHMPFIYFRSLSAVVVLIFIKAEEKMMSAYTQVFSLSQLLIAKPGAMVFKIHKSHASILCNSQCSKTVWLYRLWETTVASPPKILHQCCVIHPWVLSSPNLGKGFEIRTKHLNYLPKGSYESDYELLHPNRHSLPQQIRCSFWVLVQKGISHTEITFRENEKSAFVLFPPCGALRTREWGDANICIKCHPYFNSPICLIHNTYRYINH